MTQRNRKKSVVKKLKVNRTKLNQLLDDGV